MSRSCGRARAGHAPGAERIQSSLHCYLAESHRAALDGYRRPMLRYLEVFAEAVSSWKDCESADYAGYDKTVAGIVSTTPESLLDQQAALVGTPAEAVEVMPEAEARRTLELLASGVMERC